ncbi:MAG: ABC transporter permease [Saprospiraceae bacterium]|nr:ABC transporter permease [Saprospiraceae bacterium]
MKRYLINRLLLIIPTLFIVSVVGFYLSKQVPQDPVVSLLTMRGMNTGDVEIKAEDYAQVYLELHLDLPNFYFGIQPSNYPANLNKVDNAYLKKFFKAGLNKGMTFEDLEAFSNSLVENNIPFEVLASSNLKQALSKYPSVYEDYSSIQSRTWYWPNAHFHGFNNQYHHWVTSFFNGGFGISLVDGKDALPKAAKAIQWTLAITLVDLVISLLLGMLIGIYLVNHPETRFSKFLSQVLYAFYSMPIFWLATLLIVFFTGTESGIIQLFPSIGINIYPGESTFSQILKNFHKLILPILCLTLHSLAYIARFMSRSIQNEMDKAYILTALSKGLSRSEVIKRHALPNAMIPMVTLMGAILPAAFTGSLVLEILFNIPGFGRLLFSSINLADWNVAFCIMMIIAFVTVMSYLLVDVLYGIFNPKIRFDQ